MSTGITFERQKKLIKNHPFFTLLEEKDIEALIELIQEVSVKENGIIVKENDIIDSIYIIAEGATEVTRTVETVEGHIPILLAKLGEGDIIGLSDVGFFSRTMRRTATVTAITDVTLLKLDAIEFSMFMLGASGLYVNLTEPADQIIRSNFIRKLNLNEKINPDQFAQLYNTIESITVEAKEFIFHAGDRDDHVYLLTKGKIDILDHQENLLTAIEPVKLFGESGILDLPFQSVSAICKETSTILKLSRKNVLSHVPLHLDSQHKMLSESTILTKIKGMNFHKQITADLQPIYIITAEDKSYSMFNAVGWQVWQNIDGKNTIADIIEMVIKKFHEINKEEIMDFLAKLMNKNLVNELRK